MFTRRAGAGRLLGVVLGGFIAVVLGAGTADGGAEAQGAPRVLAVRVGDPITAVIADHVDQGLEQAESGGYSAYVIELDTPGGLVTAMRDIVEDILASAVPVIVYVSPDGARAGSAGAFISFASHVLVMAPGTTIGAATPVGLEGEKVSDKIVNDAAAQAEALAALRDRNAAFAVDTVRKGRSAAVDEALRLGVAEARAASLAEALEAADGRAVTLVGQRKTTVATAGASVVRQDMGFLRRVLQKLADPNIAFLLLTLGTLGLIYELATPGVGVAGATGATALLLALFSLSVLPVTVVGVLLLLVAAGLFIAELFVPGTAGFAFGGAVVLVLAGVFLFDDAEGVSVDLATVLPLAIVMFGAAVLAGRVAYRTRHMPSTATGADVFTGRLVRVAEAEGQSGRTFAEGAWWSIRSVGPPLVAEASARVVGLDGLVLLVEPAGHDTDAGATPPPSDITANPETKDTS
jgi:membrane-bound serine protease (ClpP class)